METNKPEEEVSNTAELSEEILERASFYRFLSSLFFKEVTDEFILNLKKLPKELCDEEGLLGQGYRELRKFMVRRGPDPRTDLAAEYAHIFLAAGVSEGDAGCPFESIYTSKEKLMMQDARDQVLKIYVEQGVNVDANLHLPEDHLSFELEFMAIMSERLAELINNNDTDKVDENIAVQRAFIQEHLQNWLPSLEARVTDMAQFLFYPAIMHITQGFIDKDAAFLADLVEEE